MYFSAESIRFKIIHKKTTVETSNKAVSLIITSAIYCLFLTTFWFKIVYYNYFKRLWPAEDQCSPRTAYVGFDFKTIFYRLLFWYSLIVFKIFKIFIFKTKFHRLRDLQLQLKYEKYKLNKHGRYYKAKQNK